ncbi:MAG TPA: LacI family DNA-binding transcriptional regulator [Dokdonella sp.]|jgi:LacI family transcriptional regulator|nr:LacI family DNA-binding transcriptional regulator [Dokdonella sp.]
MSVTIKDVAREANVSVATVSRALNGHQNVTAEMRIKVKEIATRLRYMPHGAARSLSTRRTQTIGAILPDLYGEFFSELIRGMDVAARENSMHLLVSSSHGSADETAAALRALSGRVDGLLIMSPHADATLLADNLPFATPTVLMNTRTEGGAYTAFAIDNHGGARAMVEHLMALGHRRIAMIAGPADNFDADERLRGYRDVLARSEQGDTEVILQGDFSESSGYAAGSAIARMSPRPDAVFAANDMMALGCLFALNEAGLSVPGDIALAGFDDIPMARFVSPPLTTMRVNIAELGERAARALIAQLSELNTAPEGTSAPELIVRASCGAPATGKPASSS